MNGSVPCALPCLVAALTLSAPAWGAPPAASELETDTRGPETSQWDRRDRRRTGAMFGGGLVLTSGLLTSLGATISVARNCPAGLCDGHAPKVALSVGTALTVVGASTLATFAGLRYSGRKSRLRPAAQAEVDDHWSRRMAGFGVTAGVGLAAFTGLAVGTPLFVCEGDQCSGASGVVTGALVGGPVLAIGLAGLAITGAWRHHQRRAWQDTRVAFTGMGIAGRF